VKKIQIKDGLASIPMLAIISIVSVLALSSPKCQAEYIYKDLNLIGFTFPINRNPVIYLWRTNYHSFVQSEIDSTTADMTAYFLLLLKIEGYADSTIVFTDRMPADSIKFIINAQATKPKLSIWKPDGSQCVHYDFTVPDDRAYRLLKALMPSEYAKRSTMEIHTVQPSCPITYTCANV
jgi:hypothetical protein